MKIYIHTDLEGISGITHLDQVASGTDLQFEPSVKRLMADVNAAIDGAFAGGATHVTVLDLHRGGNNFDLSLLDSRAEFDPRLDGCWWGKLDNTYDGTMFIGAHAMAGTPNAFLSHTGSSKWQNYMINGRNFGELAMWAMVAGHFDVPLIMVSGDFAACAEALRFFGLDTVAVVKYATGINKVRAIPNLEAEELIRQTAKESISRIGSAMVFKPIMPMEVKLEFANLRGNSPAEFYSDKPGYEMVDARTVRKISQNALDLFL